VRRLRSVVERAQRRRRDPVPASLPAMVTDRSFALQQRSLFRVMFGNAQPGHLPTDCSRQQARLVPGALRAAIGPWATVHGPVTLELEGIPPFRDDGERLAGLALAGLLASLRPLRPSASHPEERP
jgi:hypothetical protein